MYKKIPFLRLLLFLIVGVFFSYWYRGGLLLVFITLAFVSVIAFVVYHLTPKIYRNFRIRWISGVSAFAFLFSVGWIITDIKMPSQIDRNYDVTATGKVVSTKDGTGSWSRIVFAPNKVNNDSVPIKSGDLWLLMVKDGITEKGLRVGIEIVIKGTLHGHKANTNPYAFNYGDYLFKQGFSGQFYIDADNIAIVNKHRCGIKIISLRIREWCISRFSESGINSSRLAILSALVLGEREGIDRELNDKFIHSGAIHILAVSGLHVGIVFLILNYILGLFFKSSTLLRLVITILLLFFYAFITGFSPSVTRAVVMFSFIQTGRAYSRYINMYNILCVSAFIILLWNPMYIFHVGFLLSHLAVAGIVAFYPLINGFFSFGFIGWRWIWSVISVTLSAQITTIPLSLWLFGSFPSYFILSNIFLIPLLTPILIIAIIILLLSWIPFVTTVLGAPLNDMIGFMEDIVGFIELLPNSYITNIWFSFPLVLLFFLLIIYWYHNFENPNPYIILKCIGVVALIILTVNIQWTYKRSISSFVIFDTGRELLIEIINKGECDAIMSPGLDPVQHIYAAGGYEKRNVVKNRANHILSSDDSIQTPEVYFIKTSGMVYCVVNGGKGSIKELFNDNADVLVVAGSPVIEIKELVKRINCNTIVFASNCSSWMVKSWRSELEGLDIIIHDIKTAGAYVYRYKPD